MTRQPFLTLAAECTCWLPVEKLEDHVFLLAQLRAFLQDEDCQEEIKACACRADVQHGARPVIHTTKKNAVKEAIVSVTDRESHASRRHCEHHGRRIFGTHQRGRFHCRVFRPRLDCAQGILFFGLKVNRDYEHPALIGKFFCLIHNHSVRISTLCRITHTHPVTQLGTVLEEVLSKHLDVSRGHLDGWHLGQLSLG